MNVHSHEAPRIWLQHGILRRPRVIDAAAKKLDANKPMSLLSFS
jgi:hypothetical protein